ncbi:MAG: sterol desaturase family protein [Burkholderiaceae bacterium]
MHRIIVFAIPAFALCMAIEWLYGLVKGRNTYRLNDALSSLSQGLLSQATAVCTQLFQVGLYALIYPHVALSADGPFWDGWIGWVLAIVLFDFCDYWLHRVSHESAIFWAAHVVHHQSQRFNLSTALRQESAYLLLGWIFYLPMAVAGVPPELFGIAGLVVLVYQFWIHTEHIGSLGWLDRVFSTPSNHRVHHAVNARYLDKNYGAIFVLWDRMFGTFEPESECCVFGTLTPLNSWNPLYAVGGVYAQLLRRAWATPRWGDKLRVLFKSAGWQAPGEPAYAAAVDAMTVEPYDPPASPAQRGLASLLFVAVVLSTCFFLWQADELGGAADWLCAAGVAGGLWAVGALMAGRLAPWRGGLLGAAMVVLSVAGAGGFAY